MIPIYNHYCKSCTFLGLFSENHHVYDLYFCKQGPLPTLIARYGNDGVDYVSGIHSSAASLKEAFQRAQTKGLIK